MRSTDGAICDSLSLFSLADFGRTGFYQLFSGLANGAIGGFRGLHIEGCKGKEGNVAELGLAAAAIQEDGHRAELDGMT